MSNFYAMEQGSKNIFCEANSIDEIVSMLGPRAQSQNKTFIIFGMVGVVEPVSSYSFKTAEEIQEEIKAAAKAAVDAATVAATQLADSMTPGETPVVETV